MGHNFMGFTNFFLDYVPMYAKFRTVASILVIAEFTIPLLAALTLKQIIDESSCLAKNMKYVYVSFGLTAGVALIMALLPSMMEPFVSGQEQQMVEAHPRHDTRRSKYDIVEHCNHALSPW